VEQSDVSDAVIVRYLLGELPEAEQESLERSYFSDPALLDRMEAVEDDLIDDYVRGALTPEQRTLFERHFLNEKRRERVRMAEALRRAVPPRRAPVRAWALPLAAALFVAALLAIVWLALENRTLRERPAPAPVVAEKPRPSAAPAPAPEVVPSLPPPALATLVLSPGLTRGDETPTLVIEQGAHAVRLEALLEVEAPSYDATLQRLDGPVVWKGTTLSARKGKLLLTIPRSRFRTGEHLLTVTAPDYIADYAFTVR
jgi:anti-sigma factor RsiW